MSDQDATSDTSPAFEKAQPQEPEIYTPERIAEFLLCNAIGAADYKAARADVRALGLDPGAIPHERAGP